MLEINSKAELIASLKNSNRLAAGWFEEIPAHDFFKRQGEVWSPSDNLDHLIKTVKSITKALKLPRITLQAMFGRPEKPSVSYEDLCRDYRDAIAQGGQASGRYLPDQQSPQDQEAEKKALLEEWSKTSDELVSVADQWDDHELDQYQLPHPLLGKRTVREMLYFTIYHNLRHASQEGD